MAEQWMEWSPWVRGVISLALAALCFVGLYAAGNPLAGIWGTAAVALSVFMLMYFLGGLILAVVEGYLSWGWGLWW